MRIGAPKEVKVPEYRVELTSDRMHELVVRSHRVSEERSAGTAIGLANSD